MNDIFKPYILFPEEFKGLNYTINGREIKFDKMYPWVFEVYL